MLTLFDAVSMLPLIAAEIGFALVLLTTLKVSLTEVKTYDTPQL